MRARSLKQGLPLIGRVNRDLALDLDLFSRGGLEILRAIERRDYDVLSARPAISKRTKLALALRALGGKALPFLRLGAHRQGRRLDARRLHRRATLARAYAACRAIAKREAKNFYYALSRCPLQRRNAICAIYAFMRQADDLADDESLPREERRRQLECVARPHGAASAAGGATSDPVFLAVRDATAALHNSAQPAR